MSRETISPAWSPDRSPATRGARHVAMVLALSVLLAAAWSLGAPLATDAEGPVEIAESGHAYVFSQALEFRLSARGATPITEVILFYGRVNAPLVRRIYPAFIPGAAVEVSHTEDLESGQFAPGTMLRYWWRLALADGQAVDTDVQTFEYTDTARDWRTLEGTYVDLYWYGRDAGHARAILAASDEAVERLGDEMGVPIEERVRIYVYNSQRDMRPALSARSEGLDDRVMTLGVAVDEYTLLLLGAHRDVLNTAAHELSHIVVGIATDNPYTTLPRWLDEGLAMHAEGELPRGNRLALDDAIKADRLLTIRSMTSYSGRAADVDLFYGQAYSIVGFMLREYGREKLHDLLGTFAEGSRQEDALMRVYGLGLDALDDRWRASLGLEPRRRSGALPALPRALARVPVSA